MLPSVRTTSAAQDEERSSAHSETANAATDRKSPAVNSETTGSAASPSSSPKTSTSAAAADDAEPSYEETYATREAISWDDLWMVRIWGRFCKPNGGCIEISQQSESPEDEDAFLLDLSGLGDDNPLPSGQTQIAMSMDYQEKPSKEQLERGLRLITRYTYRVDCDINPAADCEAIYEGSGSPPAAIQMVEEPLTVTALAAGTDPMEYGFQVDAQNPPGGTLCVVIQRYGEELAPLSSDDVFYSCPPEVCRVGE